MFPGVPIVLHTYLVPGSSNLLLRRQLSKHRLREPKSLLFLLTQKEVLIQLPYSRRPIAPHMIGYFQQWPLTVMFSRTEMTLDCCFLEKESN